MKRVVVFTAFLFAFLLFSLMGQANAATYDLANDFSLASIRTAFGPMELTAASSTRPRSSRIQILKLVCLVHSMFGVTKQIPTS